MSKILTQQLVMETVRCCHGLEGTLSARARRSQERGKELADGQYPPHAGRLHFCFLSARTHLYCFLHLQSCGIGKATMTREGELGSTPSNLCCPLQVLHSSS